MRLFWSGLWALLPVGLVLSGCALLLPEPVETPPAKTWRPGELLQELAERESRLRSLRSLARVGYSGQDGRAAFDGAILVQRPDRLRLETLTSVGAVLVVTVNGKEIAGFQPREGLFYRGESSRLNIFRLTRIPLEVEELTSLLLGLPPGISQGLWRETGASIRRDLGAGEEEIAEFHLGWGAPNRWERANAHGEVILRAMFSDFFVTADGPFPLTIILEDPAVQRRLEIRYREPELNVQLPDPLFVQEKPASAKEIPLESRGG